MNNYFGGDVFVTLETPDGTVRKFKALTVSVNTDYDMIDVSDHVQNRFIQGKPKTRFEFTMTDELITSQSEIRKTVDKYKSSREWMCGYCGTPNEKKIKSCHKCGAPRSFVYEE